MVLSGSKYVEDIGIELDWAGVHVPLKKELMVIAGETYGMSQRMLREQDWLYVVLNPAMKIRNNFLMQSLI